MRSALAALLLGGCLVVKMHGEEKCPTSEPEVVATGADAFAIAGDQIYYVRYHLALSRVATTGGAVTDLAPIVETLTFFAIDATTAYWVTAAGEVRTASLSGGAPQPLASLMTQIAAFAVDDIGIEYAADGLYRRRHDDGAIEQLSPATVFDIAAHGGRYFFTDPVAGSVRSAPPDTELVTALRPAWIVADDRAVFYYERGDPSADSAGTLRAIPVDGGEPVVLTDVANVALGLALDDDDLYFVTASGPDYAIHRVPRGGGDVTTLACGSASSNLFLGVDGNAVYWSDAGALFRLLK